MDKHKDCANNPTGNYCILKSKTLAPDAKACNDFEPSPRRKYEKQAQPGQGQGVGKPRQGAGGRDFCYCPECDKKVEHKRGKPCTEQKCPDCGSNLQPA